MPPPSVICRDHLGSGEHRRTERHVTRDARCASLAGFAFGAICAAPLLGAVAGSSASIPAACRSDTAGAARHSVDRLGAAVHPLAREFSRASKIVLIAVGVFFPVYLGVHGRDHVRRPEDRRGRDAPSACPASRSFGASFCPSVLPAYVIALRTGLGLGWMFVVAAEFMGASEGLGYLLVDGQQLGKPEQIVAAIVAFRRVGQALRCATCGRYRALPALAGHGGEAGSMLDINRRRVRPIPMALTHCTMRHAPASRPAKSLRSSAAPAAASRTLLRDAVGARHADVRDDRLDGASRIGTAPEGRLRLSGATAASLALGRRTMSVSV